MPGSGNVDAREGVPGQAELSEAREARADVPQMRRSTTEGNQDDFSRVDEIRAEKVSDNPYIPGQTWVPRQEIDPEIEAFLQEIEAEAAGDCAKQAHSEAREMGENGCSGVSPTPGEGQANPVAQRAAEKRRRIQEAFDGNMIPPIVGDLSKYFPPAPERKPDPMVALESDDPIAAVAALGKLWMHGWTRVELGGAVVVQVEGAAHWVGEQRDRKLATGRWLRTQIEVGRAPTVIADAIRLVQYHCRVMALPAASLVLGKAKSKDLEATFERLDEGWSLADLIAVIDGARASGRAMGTDGNGKQYNALWQLLRGNWTQEHQQMGLIAPMGITEGELARSKKARSLIAGRPEYARDTEALTRRLNEDWVYRECYAGRLRLDAENYDV
ncbi:MAG: hypothetical protein ACE366_16775 [Bradymonadia bacterium]